MKGRQNAGKAHSNRFMVILEVDVWKQGQLLLERSEWKDCKSGGDRAESVLGLMQSLAQVLRLELVPYHVASSNGERAFVLIPKGMPQPDLLAPASIVEKLGWQIKT